MVDQVSLEQAISEARWELKNKHPVRALKILLPLKDQGWEDGDFLSILGIAYCMAGHFDEGLEVLYRELDIAPSASVHYNLGQAHQMAGDLEKAKDCYHHCQSLDPTDQHAVQALQKIYDAEKKRLQLSHPE